MRFFIIISIFRGVSDTGAVTLLADTIMMMFITASMITIY